MSPMAVNLSDLAAMGANPRWVTLNLSLPELEADWVRRFLQGFNERAQDFTAPRRAWPAKANKFNCRFCPYKNGEIWNGVMGTGHCNRNPQD